MGHYSPGGEEGRVRVVPSTGVALSLLVTWAAMAHGQTFEHARAATLGVGLLVPAGSLSDLYDPGIVGRVSVRMPISQGTTLGLESGIVAPNEKSGSPSLYQFPVRALLYFPLAPEGGSSPYLALGPGVTFNSVGKGPQGSAQRDPYFTYALKVGWSFRPETMTRTLFEIGARYEQQFIGSSSDFQSFDVEVCTGRIFQP